MADDIKLGEVLDGRYKILRPIGEGGMGSVFLAEHWLIKRRVAVKILRSEYAADAQMIRRFMNEALAAGTLGHPNIVESTDMGFTKSDVPYIVFEYLEGTLLSDEIGRVGKLALPRALKLAYQIASALEAAHDAGIVHRDLKTDNVFLTDRAGAPDHVKVLDFGISRFVGASDRTARGATVMGTPEFMAPEQITAPDAVDHRADIYALGVVLYEMLAGELPFPLDRGKPSDPTRPRAAQLEATHALLDRIVNEAPPPLAVDGSPAGFVEMIEGKLLAKDREARYQRMKDVQSALEAFASVLPSGPIAIARATSPSTPPPPPVDHAAVADEICGISDLTVSADRLAPDELAREVRALGRRWLLADGDLRLDLYSRQMTRLAHAFANIAAIADDMDHHPRVVVDVPHLQLSIAKASTVVDLVFAARLEQWLRDNGW